MGGNLGLLSTHRPSLPPGEEREITIAIEIRDGKLRIHYAMELLLLGKHQEIETSSN